MKLIKCFLDDTHTTFIFITPYAARIGARDKTTKLVSHTPFVLQKVNVSQEQKRYNQVL